VTSVGSAGGEAAEAAGTKTGSLGHKGKRSNIPIDIYMYEREREIYIYIDNK